MRVFFYDQNLCYNTSMSTIAIIILTVAACFTAIISATIGMAGGIVLLSIMTFFITDHLTLITIHAITQLTSNTTRSFKLKKHIFMPIIIPSLIGLPIGTFISVQIIQSIENKEVFFFFIAAIIFYTLFKPKKLPALKIPYWGFGILAVVVGIFNLLIGATGPLMAPFYLRDDLTKEQIVATKALNQAFGHLLKIPAIIYLGFDYFQAETITLITCMIGAVILGTHYGVKFLKKINEKLFRIIFKSALFLAACRVSYEAMNSII